MPLQAINPANGETVATYDETAPAEVNKIVSSAHAAFVGWRKLAFRERGVSIVPLLAWYDYSFGEPSEELRSVWMDYRACRWPVAYTEKDIAAHFDAFNDKHVRRESGDTVITYSHFLPRIDVMPDFMPRASELLYPILMTWWTARTNRAMT